MDLIETCFTVKPEDLLSQNITIKSDFLMALNNAFESFINIQLGTRSNISDYLVACMDKYLEE